MTAAEPVLTPFLTVGQLRAEMEGLPDDAQIVVTSSLNHRFDMGIVTVLHERLILWDHDCDDEPEGHRPGRDCPAAPSMELWLDGYDEAMAEVTTPAHSPERASAIENARTPSSPDYFVLDPQHDLIARRALAYYANDAREEGYTVLADDLEAWVKALWGASGSSVSLERAEENERRISAVLALPDHAYGTGWHSAMKEVRAILDPKGKSDV